MTAVKSLAQRGSAHKVNCTRTALRAGRRRSVIVATSATNGHDEVDAQLTSRRQQVASMALATATAWGMAGPRRVYAEGEEETVVTVDTEIVAAEPPAPPPPKPKPSIPMDVVHDETLAYTFGTPSATASGEPIKWVFSRKPEKYSAAAPLNADARYRIVAEKINLKLALTLALYVGPAPNSLSTKYGDDPSKWPAKAVTKAFLDEKSTGRIATGKRISVSDLEDSEFVTPGEIAGDGAAQSPMYVRFNSTSQGAPNLYDSDKGTRETFRRSVGQIALRKGVDDGRWYIYGLVASGPDALWDDYGSSLEAAAESFHLDKPTRDFRSPEQNSWEFI